MYGVAVAKCDGLFSRLDSSYACESGVPDTALMIHLLDPFVLLFVKFRSNSQDLTSRRQLMYGPRNISPAARSTAGRPAHRRKMFPWRPTPSHLTSPHLGADLGEQNKWFAPEVHVQVASNEMEMLRPADGNETGALIIPALKPHAFPHHRLCPNS
jgi:hypothetical protein